LRHACVESDARVADAIDLVAFTRGNDGRCCSGHITSVMPVALDVSPGQPSLWITMRDAGTRVVFANPLTVATAQ
jgi:hypothetical protein